MHDATAPPQTVEALRHRLFQISQSADDLAQQAGWAAESLQATAARAPLVGNIAAGVPEVAEQHHDGDWVTFPAAWSRGAACFAVRVVGDSMIRAGILEGDFAIVRRQETAVDGDIVAATVDCETTLKRFAVEAGHAVLKAENPQFRAIDVRGDVRIHGVVVGMLRAYFVAGENRVGGGPQLSATGTGVASNRRATEEAQA